MQLTLALEETSPANFRERLASFAALPYRKRPYSARNWGHPLHSLCSYASKLKPSIASFLVQLFTEPGSTVLDPFSGSGTIPFEASLNGRRSIAVDLSPLAYCISAAKVHPPQMEDVRQEVGRLESFLLGRAQLEDAEEEIKGFYHEATLGEILRAREYFLLREAIGDPGPAHWFVKSCVLHLLHGNRPYALSRRSHGIIPIPPKGPTVYKPLMRSLHEKISRMRLTSIPSSFVPGEAYHGSALALPDGRWSVDAIITSPPFLGTTEFLRQNRIRLWFCGWSYESQAAIKAESMFIEQHRSLAIYASMFAQFVQVLVSGGKVVMHLGVVKKTDMAAEVASLASNQGLETLGVVYEDTSALESHGRTDRGATHKHAFLFLRKS